LDVHLQREKGDRLLGLGQLLLTDYYFEM